MATGLIDIIKRASLDAVNNVQMCDLRYGTVISVKPLKVQVTNQFTIPEKLLIVPKQLTDYEVEFTFDDEDTEQCVEHRYKEMSIQPTSIQHNQQPFLPNRINFIKFKPTQTLTGFEKPKHKITIYNALKVGDKVALLRKQGGQSYFILDRI